MRSRLIKALNNRFYVKFMQLEIDLLTGCLKISSRFSKVQGVINYQVTFSNECILSILLVMHAPGKSKMAYGFLLTSCLSLISMFV